MPTDKPRTKNDVPRPGGYRATLPSVREEHSPELLDATDEKEDTGLKAADSLVLELAERNRQLAQLQETVAALVKRAEQPPPKSEDGGVEFSVKSRGINWKAIGAIVAAALPGLIAATGWGVDKYNASNAPKPTPVTPVAVDVADLSTRVGRIEACLASRAKAEQADADFVEKALELAGVRLPRRPGDEAPRVIDIEPLPLVSGPRGARLVYRITSTRPARPTCQ